MKYLKTFESLQIDLSKQNLSDLLESLSIWEDSLLSSIKAEEQDIKKMFDYIEDNTTIEDLAGDIRFVNVLSKQKLRKSSVQNSKDYETFINKSFKWLPIFRLNDSDLQNPVLLIIQSWNDSLSNWNDLKLYRVKDDIKKFYDMLSSKTIEILDGDKNYIYTTSNSGNDWELKNLKDESEMFSRFLSTEKIKDISKKKNIKVNII